MPLRVDGLYWWGFRDGDLVWSSVARSPPLLGTYKQYRSRLAKNRRWLFDTPAQSCEAGEAPVEGFLVAAIPSTSRSCSPQRDRELGLPASAASLVGVVRHSPGRLGSESLGDGLSLVAEKLQSLRGMVDLLPQHTSLWQRVESTAREQFRRAGLQEIRTPLLEPTQLFTRGIGEATDVVGKEMYTFLDRSERSCTLRPEGTASVVRAAIQHGLLSQGPQRLWYGGPMFRYERPQAGRQRQFHQIGVELLGFDADRSDVEAIALAWDLLSELGVGPLTLELNTLGSTADRARYRQDLVAFLQGQRDQLDADSLDRLERNPLRILDSKDPKTQELLLEAPTLTEALASESRERFERVQAGLVALEIPFRLNPRLVRGLDYYGHTAFEITSSALGAQATVCGGGRYDGLIEQLGGSPTAAMGWAIGLERLVLLMAQAKHSQAAVTNADLYVVNRGPAAELAALVLARGLRSLGLQVELDPGGSAFAKQFKRADRSGAPWAVVLGEEELAKGVARLKALRLQGVEDQLLELQDLAAFRELLRA